MVDYPPAPVRTFHHVGLMYGILGRHFIRLHEPDKVGCTPEHGEEDKDFIRIEDCGYGMWIVGLTIFTQGTVWVYGIAIGIGSVGLQTFGEVVGISEHKMQLWSQIVMYPVLFFLIIIIVYFVLKKYLQKYMLHLISLKS